MFYSAWIVNSALTPLAPGDCAEEKYGKKITASLKKAYLLAEERHPIEYFKEILQEHQEAEKERQEELAKKEAEKEEKKAAKAEKAAKTTDKKDATEKKTKRKSTAKSKDTVSDEDEMDVDEKEETAAKPSKKRKKEADSDAESAKVREAARSLNGSTLTRQQPKKTPKISKLKATEKTPNGDSAKKSDRKKKVVSKPAEETEEKEVLTEEQKLERREKAGEFMSCRVARPNANDPTQFFTSAIDCRRDFWHATRLPRKTRWMPCLSSSLSLNLSPILSLKSSGLPRSTRFSRELSSSPLSPRRKSTTSRSVLTICSLPGTTHSIRARMIPQLLLLPQKHL